MKLIDNSGTSKDSVIELGIPVPDNYWHCLMLPQSAKRKDRMEAIGSLYAEMMQAESLNKSFSSVTTENDIPLEYAHALRGIGRVLGYLINSDSWRSGTLQEFDKQELIKRVSQIHFNK